MDDRGEGMKEGAEEGNKTTSKKEREGQNGGIRMRGTDIRKITKNGLRRMNERDEERFGEGAKTAIKKRKGKDRVERHEHRELI